MSMSQKGSILNRRNRLLEALMEDGMPGSQSGAQVGPVHPQDGMFIPPAAYGNALMQGLSGTQSGAADYNYPDLMSTLLETFKRYQTDIPSPSAPERYFEDRRKRMGY